MARRIVSRALGVLLVTAALGGPAFAQHHRRPWRSAPEFDPAAAGAVAAIVVGGVLMLARRRRGGRS